jgi:hypothetical protein
MPIALSINGLCIGRASAPAPAPPPPPPTGTSAPFSPFISGAGASTSSSVTVLFDAPTTTVEGSPLTGDDALTSFEVYYSTLFDNANSAVGTRWLPDPSLSTTSVTVTGLAGATTFYFCLVARTAYGPSSDSNIADFVTL